MDPISSKAAGGGLSNIAGELSKQGGLGGTKGAGAKFEGVRMEKGAGGDPLEKASKMLDNFTKTGKVDGIGKEPSMADRVAARSGISFQPNLQFAEVGGVGKMDNNMWAPQQVNQTGASSQVAGAVQGLNEGQARLENIIGELRSGKEFSQGELLGLQAEVHMLSEQVQMSTKLVDSAMQSIKSVMQQQV
jgi:hypothetical protein